ncbi:hypothetical protein [Neobacillus dielmonensis]|uniref:hypothetical protein n=1 Tax=Neobacillus dielmonensis TaxID=1347369 RepID=UPI0005AB4A10|nr:hypothetical protein [Neobacillus dielmonensis]
MKKIGALMIGLLLVSSLFFLRMHAAEPPSLSEECLDARESRDEQFTNQVIKDVIATFNVDLDEHSYIEVSLKDLDAAHMIYGGKEKDEYYQSLKKHFFVATRGNPRLFVRPQEAYLFYKEPDNTNVMIHLKLRGEKWSVVGKKKKTGSQIPYELLPCEKDYLKKKKEFYSK